MRHLSSFLILCSTFAVHNNKSRFTCSKFSKTTTVDGPAMLLSPQLSNLRFSLKQVNQQAMAPTHGGHVASWTSAASKAASCGVWRCTVHLPRLPSPLALCVHSATQTCREHLRLVPQGTKWTRAQSVGQHSSQTRQKTRRWAQHRTETL